MVAPLEVPAWVPGTQTRRELTQDRKIRTQSRRRADNLSNATKVETMKRQDKINQLMDKMAGVELSTPTVISKELITILHRCLQMQTPRTGRGTMII